MDGRRFPAINRKKIPNLLEHRFTTHTYVRDYTSGLRSVKSASPLCVSGGAVYVQKIKKKRSTPGVKGNRAGGEYLLRPWASGLHDGRKNI